MPRARRMLPALAFVLVAATAAQPHEVRPGYLELRETAAGTYDMLWKVPARGPDLRLGIDVRLPADAEVLGEPRTRLAGDAFVEQKSIRRAGGLSGQTITIDGLSHTSADVLVRIARLDGATQVARLTPHSPSLVVEAAPTAWQVVRTYLGLGVEHILLGVDHLLFVLALLLLVGDRVRLVATITAFTAAHSITLAAASLGAVTVPGPPVEACIALSIAFVAAEILRGHRGGPPSLAVRRPWTVAFAFGLLHGLGFAGALHEIGLPQQAIPLALLCFNAGVEIGQLVFIALALAGIAVGARLFAQPVFHAGRARAAAVLPAYAIGSVAMFWTLQRIAAS